MRTRHRLLHLFGVAKHAFSAVIWRFCAVRKDQILLQSQISGDQSADRILLASQRLTDRHGSIEQGRINRVLSIVLFYEQEIKTATNPKLAILQHVIIHLQHRRVA